MKEPRQEQIDKYLLDQMDMDKRKAFEAAMAADPDLKREVMAQREAIAIAKSIGDEKIRQRIKKAEQLATGKKEKRPARKSLLIAVLFLLVLAALWFYFFQSPKTQVNPAAIYATYYEAYPLSFGNRGDEEILAAASIVYDEKNYREALRLFEAAAPQSSNAKIELAKGICQLELGEYEKAKQTLAGFTNDPLYGSQCRWYLALCLLKLDDLDSATLHLQSLAQSADGFKAAEAQKMLDQLKKN